MILLARGNREPRAVWVDRRSILGNPFVGARDAACNAYAEYFQQVVAGAQPRDIVEHIAQLTGTTLSSRLHMPKQQHIMTRLEELRRKHDDDGVLYLGCWCTPLRCHSETIKDYLEN